MKIFYSIILIFFCREAFSQEMQRQMLSSQGSSRTLKSGLYISQTIGQQSIVGSVKYGLYNVEQGFQQYLLSKYYPILTVNAISTNMFPLPCNDILSFKFSEPINSSLTLSIYDNSGILVYHKTVDSPKDFFSVNISMLKPQIYVAHLSASKFLYSSSFAKN